MILFTVDPQGRWRIHFLSDYSEKISLVRSFVSLPYELDILESPTRVVYLLWQRTASNDELLAKIAIIVLLSRVPPINACFCGRGGEILEV